MGDKDAAHEPMALITGSGAELPCDAQLLQGKDAVFLMARTEKELRNRCGHYCSVTSRMFLSAISRRGELRAAFDQIVADTGAWIFRSTTAGITDRCFREAYPMEEFDRVMAVHLRAAFC